MQPVLIEAIAQLVTELLILTDFS